MGAGKARIQLQLCLATGMGWTGCRDVFERSLRAIIYGGTVYNSPVNGENMGTEERQEAYQEHNEL